MKVNDIDKARRALARSNTRLMLVAVMIFQFSALILLTVKTSPFDMQAAVMALLMPSITWLICTQAVKIFNVDRALIIMAMFLCSIGIITLQDIARSYTTPRTQAEYACLAMIAMAVGAFGIRIYRNWKKFSIYLMALCLLMLFAPWVLGQWKYGARNWIELAGISMQPSEFMKPVFVVILASCLSNHPRLIKCLPALGFAAACCAIILSQRDLGAVLLYFLTTVSMFFVATSNLALTLAGLTMGAGAAVIAYRIFPYVQKRISLWQNPWTDAANGGYQIVQALIAIGSGGLFGMGLGLGSPRNIPLYHSDFIFAALTEEFGLIFSIGVLIIYVLIIMRGITIAVNARTSFHSLTAFGVVAMLGFQTMLIVGGNTQLLPLTGVTLPMISSGGSSLVSTFFGIGLLAGISSLNADDEAKDMELLEMTYE